MHIKDVRRNCRPTGNRMDQERRKTRPDSRTDLDPEQAAIQTPTPFRPAGQVSPRWDLDPLPVCALSLRDGRCLGPERHSQIAGGIALKADTNSKMNTRSARFLLPAILLVGIHNVFSNRLQRNSDNPADCHSSDCADAAPACADGDPISHTDTEADLKR